MRIFHIALALVTLSLCTACSTINSAKLWMPESFGMVAVAPQIYVDPAMEDSERTQLLAAIEAARQRIRIYYGSILCNPQIIACATEECFQKSGGVTARAKAYGSTKLLLSPRGISASMIAHEWSHAELSIRLDSVFDMHGIPAWFNEGLAVVVSNEPSHSEKIWQEIQRAGIPVPPLAELDTREKWLKATKKYGDTSLNKEQYRVVYATAGHEVRRWYRKAGRSGLAYMIEGVRHDKPFDRAYGEAEGLELNSFTSAYLAFRQDPDRPEQYE